MNGRNTYYAKKKIKTPSIYHFFQEEKKPNMLATLLNNFWKALQCYGCYR